MYDYAHSFLGKDFKLKPLHWVYLFNEAPMLYEINLSITEGRLLTVMFDMVSNQDS